MRLPFLFILIFISLPMLAQNRPFYGRVMDNQKRGIPFAIVQVKGRNEGVYCDDQGVFSFSGNADSIKTLIVSCMGFDKKEIPTEILPLDSILVELPMKATTLREVSIRAKKGKPVEAVLGKSRKQQHYVGDCYRYYGAETAIKLAADPKHSGTLKTIYIYVSDEGAYKTKFRVHVYQWDSLPTVELTDTNLIANAEQAGQWVTVDVSSLKIPVSEGVFVSVEWVAGFGNTQRVLQSDKNPEVSTYNGQVIGLTSDYGKPSRTYSRKPFHSDWEYYDSPDAQRHGGYFLNPMIYCTYTYLK